MTIDDLFRLATQQHQAGSLAEAAAGYQQVLSQQPDHADAIHMLGVREGSSHEVQNRRQHQHDSSDEEFAERGVSENPNDGKNRQRRHNFHPGEIEGLAIRAHISLDQNPAGSAAEQIHQ